MAIARMRVVTFTTRDPSNRVLEYYRSLAARAGYLRRAAGSAAAIRCSAGTSGDGAYYLIVTPPERGSDVALIVNNGR